MLLPFIKLAPEEGGEPAPNMTVGGVDLSTSADPPTDPPADPPADPPSPTPSAEPSALEGALREKIALEAKLKEAEGTLETASTAQAQLDAIKSGDFKSLRELGVDSDALMKHLLDDDEAEGSKELNTLKGEVAELKAKLAEKEQAEQQAKLQAQVKADLEALANFTKEAGHSFTAALGLHAGTYQDLQTRLADKEAEALKDDAAKGAFIRERAAANEEAARKNVRDNLEKLKSVPEFVEMMASLGFHRQGAATHDGETEAEAKAAALQDAGIAGILNMSRAEESQKVSVRSNQESEEDAKAAALEEVRKLGHTPITH